MTELFEEINEKLEELEGLYDKVIDWWDFNEEEMLIYGEFVEDKEPFSIKLY